LNAPEEDSLSRLMKRGTSETHARKEISRGGNDAVIKTPDRQARDTFFLGDNVFFIERSILEWSFSIAIAFGVCVGFLLAKLRMSIQ
jgi:hypothetical protein